MTVTQHANSKATTIEQRAEDLLSKLTLREKVALLAGKDNWSTVAIERLGIPAVVGCLNATVLLRTGDRVRVHGANGIVEILETNRR